MRDQVEALLGCDWGHRIATADYPQPCHTQAAQIVVLHDPNGGQMDVKLCDPHRQFVLMETDPRAGGAR